MSSFLLRQLLRSFAVGKETKVYGEVIANEKILLGSTVKVAVLHVC